MTKPPASPPPLPATGGSFIRQPDGSLKKADVPAKPAAKAAPKTEA